VHFAARRYENAVECLKQSIATGRSLADAPWIDLAASLAHLGRLEEAEAALQEGQKRTEWERTVAEFRRTYFAVDPEIRDRYIDGLRKAGLPE
jgi:tetratricopeptide (TPR) repeat protein